MSNDPLPTTVYHYTNVGGLLGILRDASIWCTHLHYLNDSLEHRIGHVIYKECLAELGAGIAGNSPDGQIARQVARVAQYRLPSEDQLTGMYHSRFTASFSASHDELTQWRGYSNGGPKFCLGFSVARLTELAGRNRYEFSQVDYDNEALKQRMRAEFSRRAKLLWEERQADGYHPGEPMAWEPGTVMRINSDVRNLADAFVKHKSFSSEQEYRLVSRDGTADDFLSKEEVLFRYGQSFLVPYVSFSLADKGALVSITVGPTPHPKEAMTALELLIRQTRESHLRSSKTLFSPDLTLKASEIPFRDWQ